MPPPKKKLSERRRRRLQKLTVWRVVILLVVLGLMVLAAVWPLPNPLIFVISFFVFMLMAINFDPRGWLPYSIMSGGYLINVMRGWPVSDWQVVDGLYRACIFGVLFVVAVLLTGDDLAFAFAYGMSVGGLMAVYLILVVYGIRETRAAHGLPRSRRKPYYPFPIKT